MDPSSPTPSANATPRPAWRAALRWALALLLVALVVRLVWADPEPLLRLLDVPAEILIGCFSLVLLNQLLMSVRLALAVEQCGGRGVPARTWFRLTSVAQFLNLFVPQLGNVYRAVALKRDHGITYMSYASGLVAFVWLDLVMGFLIALGVVLVWEPGLSIQGVNAAVVVAAVVVVSIAAPFVLARGVRALRLTSPLAERVQSRAARLLEAAGGAAASRGFLLRFFAINLLVTATHVAMIGLGFQVVGVSAGLGVLVVFQVFVKLSNQVAITPGNLGLTELAYGLLAHATHSTLEEGIAAGVFLRAVGTVAVIVLGVISGGVPLLLGARRLSAQPDDRAATKK